MSGQSYGQSIEWFKLWRRVSSKGNEYFVGRCAGAKVIVFARQKESDDDAGFIVMLQAPNPQQQQRPANAQRPRREEPRERMLDDAVPI